MVYVRPFVGHADAVAQTISTHTPGARDLESRTSGGEQLATSAQIMLVYIILLGKSLYKKNVENVHRK